MLKSIFEIGSNKHSIVSHLRHLQLYASLSVEDIGQNIDLQTGKPPKIFLKWYQPSLDKFDFSRTEKRRRQMKITRIGCCSPLVQSQRRQTKQRYKRGDTKSCHNLTFKKLRALDLLNTAVIRALNTLFLLYIPTLIDPKAAMKIFDRLCTHTRILLI